MVVHGVVSLGVVLSVDFRVLGVVLIVVRGGWPGGGGFRTFAQSNSTNLILSGGFFETKISTFLNCK